MSLTTSCFYRETICSSERIAALFLSAIKGAVAPREERKGMKGAVMNGGENSAAPFKDGSLRRSLYYTPITLIELRILALSEIGTTFSYFFFFFVRIIRRENHMNLYSRPKEERRSRTRPSHALSLRRDPPETGEPTRGKEKRA